MKKNYLILFVVSILIIGFLQFIHCYNFICFIVAYIFGLYVSKTDLFRNLNFKYGRK